MILKNILIIDYTESRYNALNYFANELYKGFIENDVNVTLAKNDSEFKKVKFKKYDLLIRFNAHITEQMLDELNLSSNTPVLTWYVDHPIDQYAKIRSASRIQLNGFIDRKHVDFVNKYMVGSSDCNMFIPHGGIYLDDIIPYNDRKYDITFTGSYIEPDILLDSINSQNSGYTKQLKHKLIELLWTNPRLSLEDALAYQLSEENKLLPDDSFAFICHGFSDVDVYIRMLKRKFLLEFLSESGFKVDVFGKGWDAYNGNRNNITFHEAVDYETGIDIYKQSKITVCCMPLFTNGSHERIFTALGAGCIPLTDGSIYFSELFQDSKNICFYNTLDYTGLKENISDLLINFSKANEIITEGRKIAKDNTWKCRAKYIINLLEDIDIIESTPFTSESAFDDEFAELTSFIASNDEDSIYAKLLNRYLSCVEFSNDYTNKFEESMNKYKYWGELSEESKNFELISNRASVLKNNIYKFIELYRALNDRTSKEILTNILKNWISFSPSYLSNCVNISKHTHYFDIDIIISNPEEVLDEFLTEKITFTKPKLAISVYHGHEELFRLWEYIASLRDDYTYYLRYYGETLYPNKIVLYCV